MANISVFVSDQNADRNQKVSVNENLHVGDFVQQLVAMQGLPETDESNLRLTYRLARSETNQILNESQSLREAGVTDGSSLMLLPEPTAGLIPHGL